MSASANITDPQTIRDLTETDIKPESTEAESSSSLVDSNAVDSIVMDSSMSVDSMVSTSTPVIKSRIQRLRTGCPICISMIAKKEYVFDVQKFCSKHNKPFACLYPTCNNVFPNIELFKKHYILHLKLNNTTQLCMTCYQPKLPKHDHNSGVMFRCCSTDFPRMDNFVLHKLSCHSGKIITSSKQCKLNVISNSKVSIAKPLSTNVTIDSLFNLIPINLFTCLVSDCDAVFIDKKENLDHFIQHANLDDNFEVCDLCLHSNLKSKFLQHGEHNCPAITCEPCSIMNFDSLKKLALHKLLNHKSTITINHSPGCPVCNKTFKGKRFNGRNHYLKCFSKLQEKKHKAVLLPETTDPTKLVNNKIVHTVNGDPCYGDYKCTYCNDIFNEVSLYVKHLSNVHHLYIAKREKGARLCPLCDTNIVNEEFIIHVDECTNKMKISADGVEPIVFECIYCVNSFELTPSLFRNHVIFCRSIKKVKENNVEYNHCRHCLYKSTDVLKGTTHALYQCIYYALKTKYALKPEAVVKKELVDANEVQYPSELPEDPLLSSQDTQQLINELRSLNEEHLKSCKLYCSDCKKTFHSLPIFNKHFNKRGQKCTLVMYFECDQCQNHFNNVEDFKAHLSNNSCTVPKAVSIVGDLQVIKSEIVDTEEEELLCYDENYMGDDVEIENIQDESGPREEKNTFAKDINEGAENHIRDGIVIEKVVSRINEGASTSFQEIEVPNLDDNAMVCEVEDKYDLQNLLSEVIKSMDD